ncbi:response regulator [Plebeiibacterium marinum]|uniref:Response regulator n=1 Tax=Plebeiibacterium marinum TaxID=2992111 RepID=A0AAE3MDE1_9BACT|nr:response regulator [Plebeiobacterium marinum]MCW3804962.1 response regulator [Plebeiobacterium marinum]
MILYLDDEPINLKLFELMFKGVYDVVLSQSPDEALGIVAENKDLSIVVTDMKMPVMNGVEFVKKAKELNAAIPYFLLSGYGLNDEINEALESNVLNGYFQKPLNRDRMKEVFAKYLQ